MDTKKQKKPLLITICILSALLVLGLVLGLTVFFKFRMIHNFLKQRLQDYIHLHRYARLNLTHMIKVPMILSMT